MIYSTVGSLCSLSVFALLVLLPETISENSLHTSQGRLTVQVLQVLLLLLLLAKDD